MKNNLFIFLLLTCGITQSSIAQNGARQADLENRFKPIVLNASFVHDKWNTQPTDIIYEFSAFTTSFDSEDPTEPGGENISWGIPEWVAFEIQKGSPNTGCGSRPSPWLTDNTLFADEVAPKDATYKVSGVDKIESMSPNYRYSRGHLCPYATAKRISCDAAFNTCTILNAVPQLQWQNNGIWKKLETSSIGWANNYDNIWVITGPVFFNKEPSVWLGQQGEFPIAVPDAMYKIIIREANNVTGVETLAFVIPNIIPKDKPLKEYVTSIAAIESFTGLTFLNALTQQQQAIEKIKHAKPPLPSGYSNMTSSQRKKVRETRNETFYATNEALIATWIED